MPCHSRILVNLVEDSFESAGESGRPHPLPTVEEFSCDDNRGRDGAWLQCDGSLSEISRRPAHQLRQRCWCPAHGAVRACQRMSSGSEGGSGICGKFSASGANVGSTSAKRGVRLTGPTTRRSPALWTRTSSVASSSSGGILTTWFHPFRKRRVRRADLGVSGSRLCNCPAYAVGKRHPHFSG